MLNLKADTRRKLLVEIQTEIHLKKKSLWGTYAHSPHAEGGALTIS